MKRRSILKAATGAGAAWAFNPVGSATEPSLVPPPKVLYSNDTTNIMSCVSPWRDKKDGLTDEHLRQTIREAEGADVHVLQPGLGWIPWWESKLYSPKEHYEVFLKSHGIDKPNAVGRYLLEGGDLVRTLTDECGKDSILPFVSIRLNDGHHTRKLADALKKGKPDPSMSRFYWEHLDDYRIGDDVHNWDESVFDWRFPEVRDHKAAMIEELCDSHEFAGLELDFLRHWVRFSPQHTTEDERREITTAFVKRMRRAVDRKTFAGKRRWLGVRVPALLDIHPDQGIDLAAMAKEAGIDFVNLSYSYFTRQDDAVARIRQIVPAKTSVYAEMTHTTLTGKAISGSGTQPYLRTTDEQFYTTAHLAYEQGATGVSFFNFAYYREHSLPDLGPFHEPPFHVLAKVADRDFVARQGHWYFLSEGRRDPVLGDDKPLPALIQKNAPHRFSLLCSPTAHQVKDGLLRFRSPEDISDRTIEVRLNGQSLQATPFVAKPIDHPYDVWLGEPEEFVCFRVPRPLIRKGENEIEFIVTGGIRVKLMYLDLTLPV
ncbi:MAG: hypothetical protein KDN19_06280 [Verrucomicrobiae bacterium]|nr:hypothetical protein [Verrucomicrobiae bacterium]